MAEVASLGCPLCGSRPWSQLYNKRVIVVTWIGIVVAALQPLALVCIVFLHSSVVSLDRISKLDFDDAFDWRLPELGWLETTKRRNVIDSKLISTVSGMVGGT